MAAKELSHIGEVVQNLVGAHVDGLRSGMEYGEAKFRPALRALASQYIVAQADENAKIPTALGVAIEGVLKLLPPAPSTKPDWIDKPEVDLDVCGRPMRPGS